MRTQQTAALACAAACAMLWSTSVYAQATAAEALYQDAQRLMSAGDTHGACLKFQESQRADPAIGTLINLATCHEKEGKTASAWSEFTDAASQAQRAGQHDREEFAKGRAAALEKQLHKLVLEVPHPPPGMIIRLDGEPFGLGSLGTPIPLDPGEHTVQVSAPGKKAWTQNVKMGPGAVVEKIEVPALENGPSDAGAGATPVTNGAGATTEVPPAKRSIVPWVIGGVGVAGLALGGIAGAITLSKRSDLDDHCHGSPLRCDAQGLSDASTGKALGPVSTVGFIVGGLGIATATVLLVTRKPASATTVGLTGAATASGGSFRLQGTW